MTVAEPQAGSQPSLGDRLVAETHIVKAIAATPEGEFVFDIHDAAVGWSLATGGWEQLETLLIKHIVESGDVVVDIGANLGWHTVVAARLAGTVVAIEPEPTNHGLLLENIERAKVREHVVPLQIAATDEEGELELEISLNNFGDHRVRVQAGTLAPSYYDEKSRRTICVPGRPLDAVLADLHLDAAPIRLLKVDTQGSEVRVFRGARETLKRTQWMVSEFWPYGLQRSGTGVDEFCEVIESNFRGFARLNTSDIRLTPIEHFRNDVRAPADNSPGTPTQFSSYLFSK